MKTYQKPNLEEKVGFGSSQNVKDKIKKDIKTQVYNLKTPLMVSLNENSINNYISQCDKLYRRSIDFELTEEAKVCKDYLVKARKYKF